MFRKIFLSFLIVFVVGVMSVMPVSAGEMVPSATPASTMHSLEEIAGSGFSTSLHSLKVIYDKIASLATNLWSKQTSELTTSGSVGELLVNNLDTSISSRSTLAKSDILADSTAFNGADVASTLTATSATNAVLTGTYDASGASSNANGNITEQLEFIMQNLGGYTYGSATAAEVLTSANGTYKATNLIATNVRSGVSFGAGLTGSYGGGSWDYGSGNAARVLTIADAAGTYDASNLGVATVKSGTTFGVGQTGAYPSATNTLPSASATTDLAASGSDITSANGAVEWWQSDGVRQTATLDFPTASNVCASDTVNGTTGTLTVGAGTIGVGNTVCGTAGTLLADQFNGTSGAFTGGAQADGGADDYNNGSSVATGRYETAWTQCTSGNNYCGTGDSGADALDTATNLVWSLPCNGSGCASFSDSAPLTYSWSNSHSNNNSRTAAQLCSDNSGWSLPHQKQLMQAYVDGSYGNLEATGTNRYYWSASTRSWSTTTAWGTNLSHGDSYFNAKTSAYYVRCVRLAS